MVKSTGRSVQARISLSIGIEFSQCTFSAAVGFGRCWSASAGVSTSTTTPYSQIFKSIMLRISKVPKICQVQPGYAPSSKHREIHLSTAQKYLQCRRSRRSIGVGTFVVDCLRIIRILVVRTGPDLLFYDRLCNKLSS